MTVLVVAVDQVVCGPRIRNLFVLLRHRGRPRSGLPDGSVGVDVCTNPTPWPAWAPAPLARSEALADRATSTYTNKGQHGRDAATTWASAARTCSPARCMPPLAGVRAQLTEATVRVDPADVYCLSLIHI